MLKPLLFSHPRGQIAPCMSDSSVLPLGITSVVNILIVFVYALHVSLSWKFHRTEFMDQPSLSSSQDHIPSLHSNMYLKIPNTIYHATMVSVTVPTREIVNMFSNKSPPWCCKITDFSINFCLKKWGIKLRSKKKNRWLAEAIKSKCLRQSFKQVISLKGHHPSKA